MTTRTTQSTLDSRLASFEVEPLQGIVHAPSQVRPISVPSGPMTVNLPSEVHSSAHQVRYEGSLIGEYEVRIFRGASGPVIVLEEGSSSPLPLEYLSEVAVTRFLDALPSSQARFFERHLHGAKEQWVEVIKSEDHFRRDPCRPAVVNAALTASEGGFD